MYDKLAAVPRIKRSESNRDFIGIIVLKCAIIAAYYYSDWK
jgi:hypothetical protein